MSDEEGLHRALGLTDEEYERIVRTLGRGPNRAELAMYSVMWSEHCSYKSSKVFLRQLPTEGPQVLVGPGSDAGAVDIGDGLAAVFKMESHSHPSAIEPFQGAATGVGGIIRDVVSMGARPVALLDPLRFGPLTEARNRWLFGGVVAGIGRYGNSIGVPTVGGEIAFAEPHGANPTVNVMCVGIARADSLVPSSAGAAGNLLVLIGASTGRDGIGGVSVLASATLEAGSEENRPSVQIGDPFTEKLLIEGCLELIDRGLIEGLQDLGGAGLTCAVSETVSRAGLGADLDLDVVPRREQGLEPFEVLISESQERMLAVVRPENLADVEGVCGKWGLEAAVVGEVVEGATLTARSGGQIVAEVPAKSLADEGPVYERPAAEPRRAAYGTRYVFGSPGADTFLSVLGSPNIAGKKWVWEQYDFLVQGGTIAGPGADAAVIRVGDGKKALVLSTDGKGRCGALDPYLGAAHAVAEAARNVAVMGACPLAITNCMNFGNPERPEVMWQFAESIRGMSDACRALGTPVTGGNVSFYNESGGSAIWPTPVIGMLGLIEDYTLIVRPGFDQAGRVIYLLGETKPEFGGSELEAVASLGGPSARPPELDLEREAALHTVLIEAARHRLLASAHDCSDGGLAIALAESALAGNTGLKVWLNTGIEDRSALADLFSESASRAVVSLDPAKAGDLEKICRANSVPARKIGATGGDHMRFDGLFEVSLDEARRVYENAIPDLLERPAELAG